jgi:DNA-binding transcriptional LysR family regulator
MLKSRGVSGRLWSGFHASFAALDQHVQRRTFIIDGPPQPACSLNGLFADCIQPGERLVGQFELGHSAVVQPGTAVDLAVSTAVAGLGIIHLFEEWLRPHLDSGALQPVLKPWWQSFSGPFLYYPGRRRLPAPLRAFVDFIKN